MEFSLSLSLFRFALQMVLHYGYFSALLYYLVQTTPVCFPRLPCQWGCLLIRIKVRSERLLPAGQNF